jgi:FtsP/CotA-like multicopper oxidase with cupredoxin domain
MVTHNLENDARCYFWLFKVTGNLPGSKAVDFPSEVLGPTIYSVEGNTITLNLSNDLTQNHRFAIPGAGIASHTIAPGGGQTSFTFTVPPAGTYLCYDDLNTPVNRVMGLHGALVSMPAAASGA